MANKKEEEDLAKGEFVSPGRGGEKIGLWRNNAFSDLQMKEMVSDEAELLYFLNEVCLFITQNNLNCYFYSFSDGWMYITSNDLLLYEDIH